MSGYTRRFDFIPTLQEIRSIEGLVLIDLVPAPTINGAGTGAVLIVGEFEDGPFAVDLDQPGVLEVFGSADFVAKYGQFGFEYNGIPSQNPCARERGGEFWNGNGFIKAFGLKAPKILIARVDTSIGEVAFSPQACFEGTNETRPLEVGDTLEVTTAPGGTGSSEAIEAEEATVLGSGSTFASIGAGDTFGIKIDGGGQVNVVFSVTDTAIGDVVTRVNLALGYTGANDDGGELELTGRILGRAGSVELIEVTVGLLANLGHVVGLTTNEASLQGGAFGSMVSADEMTIDVDGAGPVSVGPLAGGESIATVIGLINAAVGFSMASNVGGEILLRNPAGGNTGQDSTFTLADVQGIANFGFAAGTTTGTGNVDNVDSVTPAEVVALITAGAIPNVEATLGPKGNLRVCADVGSTVLITDDDMATVLGLTTGEIKAAADHGGGVILAGTRVRDSGGREVVTMQTLEIPDGVDGPYLARVRHALDDGTGLAFSSGDLNVPVDQPEFALLQVTNPSATLAAKTEPQMDNAYTAALAITLLPKLESKRANYLLIARRSDPVVRDGISNTADARTQGLFGRKFITGAPLGTAPSDLLVPFNSGAISRTDRMFYTVMGMKTRIPAISEIGSAGGPGFTDDGVITVRPDTALATICATRPFPENPGQATGLIDQWFEVDDFGNSLEIEAYKFFKANGFAAPILNLEDGMQFQSGVTSSLNPSRLNISRRKVADFILDSFQLVLPLFIKKLNTKRRRQAVLSAMQNFLGALKSEGNPELAQIEDFSLNDGEPPNTKLLRGQGVHIVTADVRSLSTLDNIVISATIGEQVVVEEA